MTWFVPGLGFALLAAAAPGCGKKALQTVDGSGGIDPIGPGGDGGVTDIGRPADAGGAVDVSWDLPVAVLRSYVVASQVTAAGGVTTGHTFTITLDTDRRVAIFGTPGSGEVAPLEQTASGALRFTHVVSFSVPVQAACGGALAYDDLGFLIEADGLSGNGIGRLTTYAVGGVGTTVPATMTLTGVPDTEPPTLSLSASGDLADPWTSLWVVSSEPLPGDQMPPVLRSERGDVLAFAGPAGGDAFFAVVERPRLLLGFGEQYRITFDSITDFARNPARWAADTTFTTRAPPPLVTPDGFESVADGTLGGAQILSGAGAPTITGARSLYMPPAPSLASWGFVTQLALRVPVSSSSTTLRFAYRFVNPGDTSGVYLVVASVGGAIQTVSLDWSAGSPTTAAMIGQDSVLLGPTTTASITLPPDVHDEVVFARIASQSSSCGGAAPPPVPGIIIDDLRAQ